MELLKSIFPLSFKKKDGVISLLINILVQLIVGVIAGVCIALLSKFPAIGIVGGLIDLYVIVGIILSILHFAGILK